ncbi:hypothetical protein HDU86_007274 [Geranomyces michiganensis]|nr:hypothetical protein HDU86_007274 [Geranomyces michiganensis]
MADDAFRRHRDLLERQKVTLQKAKALAGTKPTAAMKRTRTELVRVSMVWPLQAQQYKARIATTLLGEAYTPCVKSLSELEPIVFRDLRLETHHRGRVLIARTFCPSCRMTSVQAGIEDAYGEVGLLAVYNQLPTIEASRLLPINTVVAVKEPYYKIDKMIPPTLSQPAAARDKRTPGQLREDGNAAFKAMDWLAAEERYSEALELCPPHGSLRHTLHRNRAGARIHLGRFELAVADADAALIPGEAPSEDTKAQNVKAHFRAGRAWYELGHFAAAKEHFENGLALAPANKECRDELHRAVARLVEEVSGTYDFDAMSATVSREHCRLDHASFTKNTMIANAGHCGRGLFATTDIRHGELLLVEKAFSVAFPGEMAGQSDFQIILNLNTNRGSFGTAGHRLYRLVEKMLYNPEQASLYLDLSAHDSFPTKTPQVVDGKVALDTFHVQAVAENNGFGCPDAYALGYVNKSGGESKADGPTGIWLHAAYMNHSCVPNSRRTFIGDMMIIRASRDIRAGEELTMSYYHDPKMAYKDLKQKLSQWHFECQRIGDQQARGLAAEADVLVEAFKAARCTPASVMPAAMRKRGRTLLKGLRATYPPDLFFTTLPRRACLELGLWLCRSGEPLAAVAANALVLLRDFGYVCTVDAATEEVVVNRSYCNPEIEAVHAAMYANHTHLALGKPWAAAAFEKLAREIYLVSLATMRGFDETFM